jgi:hypothetical protein
MAIKITKPGQKEFHGFCKWCGCEFTYEISDLKLSATSDKISCPTCGKDYHHPSMVQDPTIPGGIGRLQTWPPEPIPCTPDMTKTDPCAGCTWRENLYRNGVYVGDTPCQWCDKNKFNTITCEQPSLNDYLPRTISLETHLTDTKCNCGDNAVCSKCSDTSSTLLNFDVKESDKITCMCQGDIWNTCGCKAECFSGSSTDTTIEATQANCNHCIDQISKSITDKV